MTASFLNKLIAQSDGQEVTISSYNDRVHPTIGIYKRYITSTIKQQIDSNEFKLMKMIEKVQHQIIPFSSAHKDIDPIINAAKPIAKIIIYRNLFIYLFIKIFIYKIK